MYQILILGLKPKIIHFEPVIHAREGERVTLQVNFTGSPTPAIKWTFNKMMMKGDYATELGADGSLVFYCVELKHSGMYVGYIVYDNRNNHSA